VSNELIVLLDKPNLYFRCIGRYRFRYINVGAPGRRNDFQVYEQSDLKALINGSNIFESNAKEIERIMVPINILVNSAF